MKSVYLIEIDLDEDNRLEDILNEHDRNSNVKQLRFKTLEEYEMALWYDDYLGA